MHNPATSLDSLIGYRLKEAQTLLRSRMDEALRGFELTTPQYTCLELLSRTPGASNSELARGAFVTRQTMNTLLQSLADRGLVKRAAAPDNGRVLPTTLTPSGEAILVRASDAVRAIEAQFVSGLDSDQRQTLHEYLGVCIAALRG
ncbi:MarR family transcriptional regulator [Leucobacter insecticola]|uniref:MarR family transcriptional regulator n=1 Tax=Leucobacter insecticola TaxID=2714934 RepID=A0A6G8FH84_9MICO|nr:MarR family transcriptional regulator [Leucobacter insecticola]QIM15643.1 MarR family transcriptional regulator [Leucobacter insecticola]